MKTKEEIKEQLDYLQQKLNRPIRFDEEAIANAFQKGDDRRTLPVKILSVFGGIMACLTFVAFLLATGLYDSGTGLLISGITGITGAIWINKKHERIITDTISISFYLIGFLLSAIGFATFQINESVVSLIFIFTTAIVLTIVRNHLLAFISVMIINAGILTIIISNEAYDLIHLHASALAILLVYIFRNEATLIVRKNTLSKLYQPIRIGIIFSLLSGLFIVSKKALLPISPNWIWVSSVVMIGAITVFIYPLMAILKINRQRSKIVLCTISIIALASTALSPAISGSILIILLSFWVSYKTGLIIGIVALIYFIAQFYYDLNFTLLTKSVLLFSTGILFIALYLLTRKMLTSNEKI